MRSPLTIVAEPESLPLQPVEIDIHEVIAILRRQKRLIIVTMALLIGLAFAYLLTATPKYQATALIQIDTGNTNLLDPNAVNGMQSTILSANVDGEVELLRRPVGREHPGERPPAARRRLGAGQALAR